MKLMFLKNKNILITGGTGSIGSALVFKLMKSNCKVIRVMSNDENSLFELSNQISQKFQIDYNFYDEMEKNKIRFFLGDVRDYNRCLQVTRNVDIVIHAAALKHVAISEYNPNEVFQTNVNGTKNIYKASIKNSVKKFLFISTDKVVYPQTLMGKSKLCAEKYVINDKKTKMLKSAIRFGNILGSRGSVIPKFVNSLKKKKSIIVTHEKMARFVMSTNDAVNSIITSLEIMKGNEIFVLKSMKCFRIKDLAYALIKFFKVKKNKITILNKLTIEKFTEELFTIKEIPYIKINKGMFIITKKKLNMTKHRIGMLDKYRVSNFNFLNKNQIIKLVQKNKIL
jgi:UDP-N-acetylglucosamine 4,6-dehydratase